MQTLTQRKTPLTQQQRGILATVINLSDEFNITAADIWTIRLDETVNVMWVHLYDGKQLPFDRNQFKAAVAQVKAEIIPNEPVGMPIPQGLQVGEIYESNTPLPDGVLKSLVGCAKVHFSRVGCKEMVFFEAKLMNSALL